MNNKKHYEETKKEQSLDYSKMIKETMLYLLNAQKEVGILNTEKFIDFWEKQ